jgi:hypothetical protein
MVMLYLLKCTKVAVALSYLATMVWTDSAPRAEFPSHLSFRAGSTLWPRALRKARRLHYEVRLGLSSPTFFRGASKSNGNRDRPSADFLG